MTNHSQQNQSDLLRHLAECTVAITYSGKLGTGFFLGPGLILTCAHVISGSEAESIPDIRVSWNGVEFDGEVPVGRYLPKPGPDLALLRVSLNQHPWVLIDARRNAVDVDDRVASFGYPETHRAGDFATFVVEGLEVRHNRHGKLKLGQAEAGMSGSPVLNLNTGAVCGIMRLTRDRHSDLGARFVTMFAVSEKLPEALSAQDSPSLREWLGLLTDSQLRNGRQKYAGPQLRAYLSAARAVASVHPYALALPQAPQLENVYVRQLATQADSEHQEDADADHPEQGHDLSRRGPVTEATSVVENMHGAVVIGGPGSGKSSLLRHLTAVLADRWLSGAAQTHVPIRVMAESLAGDAPLAEALARGTTRELGATALEPFSDQLVQHDPVVDTPWLVMIDGVDEILDENLRRKVLRVIEYHRESATFKFLVASRPLPTAEMRILTKSGIPLYFIEPFSESQLPALAAKWFAALEMTNAEELLGKFIWQLADSHMRQLARIPLIATMICIVFASNGDETLPASRKELYARFVEVLLGKQIGQLNIRSQFKGRIAAHGSGFESSVDALINNLRSVLQVTAYERQSGRQESVGDLALDYLRELKPAQLQSELWDSLAREAMRQSGLVVERSGHFSFLHQTIEEYMAACELAARIRPDAKLRAGLLIGTAPGSRFVESLRLFLASIWLEQGEDLEEVLEGIIKLDSAEAASFISSIVLDGGILPERLQYLASRLLERRLGPRAIDASGLLSIEAILILQDAESTMRITKRALDPNVDYYARMSSLSTLDKVTSTGDVDRLQLLAADRAHPAIRIVAARILAASGIPVGRNILLAMIKDRKLRSRDRIQAATELASVDRELAMGLILELVDDQDMARSARLEAAETLSKYDYEAFRVITRKIYLEFLSNLDVGPYEIVEAALGLMAVDRDAGVEAIVSLGVNPATDSALRIELGKLLSSRRRVNGSVAIFRSVAVDPKAPEVFRLEALRIMLPMAPDETVECMSRLSSDMSLSAESRRRLLDLMQQ